MLAVQHENPLDCDRVREREGCSGVCFSSKRPGPTRRSVGDGDEKERATSTAVQVVWIYLFISKWRLFARGGPKSEV